MIGAVALLGGMTVPYAKPVLGELRREFRGVWVATVDNIDWPSKRGLTTEAAQRELLSILDTAQLLKLNAIVFQVRPSADALYPSKIEPWSEYLTGAQGKAPDPLWDPLAFAVQEAHRRGMELHCWFNPYRAWHPAAKGKPARNYVGLTSRSAVRKYGRYEWMDPGIRAVQDRTIAVFMDVARRYDIDGIHIDDYFYPYKEKGPDGKPLDFPDSDAYAAYRQQGGTLTKDDWRRENVNAFIQRFYTQLKQERPWVKFGISPFGIYRPGIPAGIKAGVDQYADLYADCLKWWHEGWCDYMSPQLYWPIAQTAQSYPVLLKWWLDENKRGRHLWVGNYTSRLDSGNGNWAAKEVADQIALTRELGAGGNVHFSMKAFSRNWKDINGTLSGGAYREYALPPDSPWLDREAPPSPTLVRVDRTAGSWRAEWKPGAGEPIRFYVVSVQSQGTWATGSISSVPSVVVPDGLEATRIRVTPVDRVGNTGEALEIAAPEPK